MIALGQETSTPPRPSIAIIAIIAIIDIDFATSINYPPNLIFVIFLHGQNFWRVKFTPKNANFSR